MTEKIDTVAACGLYCNECYRYKKGKCPGCSKNEKATWCTIRKCTKEHGYSTCADCHDFVDVHECKKFHTIFSKFFYYFFRSDRRSSIQKIREIGIPAYTALMKEQGRPVIKRK